MRNKNGQTAQELVKSDDQAILDLFGKAQAEDEMAEDDIARMSSAYLPVTTSFSYSVTGDDEDEDDVASDDSY